MLKKISLVITLTAFITISATQLFAQPMSYEVNMYNPLPFSSSSMVQDRSLLLSETKGNNEEIQKEKEHYRTKASLYEYETKRKSKGCAWAMSFFIGFFLPVLGTGQYYAHSYKTAIPTTIIGAGSYAAMIYGIVKNNKDAAYAGAGIYLAAWVFDWIYAIIATGNYNENLRKTILSSNSIKPYFAISSENFGNNGKNRTNIDFNNDTVSLGLSMQF